MSLHAREQCAVPFAARSIHRLITNKARVGAEHRPRPRRPTWQRRKKLRLHHRPALAPPQADKPKRRRRRRRRTNQLLSRLVTEVNQKKRQSTRRAACSPMRWASRSASPGPAAVELSADGRGAMTSASPPADRRLGRRAVVPGKLGTALRSVNIPGLDDSLGDL